MKEAPFSAEILLKSPAETAGLGARIAAALEPGDAVALKGDLGAGKTTLARAILAALGLSEAVPSPTFTLVQRYETPGLTIAHFDLYRVEREAEIEELGLDDALVEGAALIEWPEHAGSRLPQDALHVQLIAVDETSRRAILSGSTRWSKALGPELGSGAKA
jgi:tRNA threonylcarbamoyl adenosine modification protein YjeE